MVKCVYIAASDQYTYVYSVRSFEVYSVNYKACSGDNFPSDQNSTRYITKAFINPRCACAAKIMVLGLCVCVCLSTTILALFFIWTVSVNSKDNAESEITPYTYTHT